MNLFETLQAAGPTFSGSDDAQCAEIANEWMARFPEGEACDWIVAGFWDPETARCVADLGIDPGDVGRLANDNITGSDDPVYEMCNGDLPVTALV